MQRVMLLWVIGAVHLASAAKCHSCFDPEILQYKQFIPEMSFKEMSKLPSCVSPELRQCFVGCYELKLEKPSTSAAYIRYCATDRVVSLMRPGGTNKFPVRQENEVTINAYMCTLNKCNDKFGKEAKPFFIPSWLIIVGIVAVVVPLVLIASVIFFNKKRRSLQNNQYNAVSSD